MDVKSVGGSKSRGGSYIVSYEYPCETDEAIAATCESYQLFSTFKLFKTLDQAETFARVLELVGAVNIHIDNA